MYSATALSLCLLCFSALVKQNKPCFVRLDRSHVIEKRIVQRDDIPDNFDAREHWPHCPSIGEIRQQSLCGSCWAFAAVNVATDRICIASNGIQQPRLSAYELTACCQSRFNIPKNGCDGGDPVKGLQYYQLEGLTNGYETKGCQVYSKWVSLANFKPGEDWKIPTCSKNCHDGSPISRKYFGRTVQTITTKSVRDIQTEILTNGPVFATFSVYKDFDPCMYNSSIVYTRDPYSKFRGGHAVKIIGWGVLNSVDYWLVANSWGDDHRTKDPGFFKIRRGTNEVGFEADISFSEPDLGRKE